MGTPAVGTREVGAPAVGIQAVGIQAVGAPAVGAPTVGIPEVGTPALRIQEVVLGVGIPVPVAATQVVTPVPRHHASPAGCCWPTVHHAGSRH